MKFNIECTCEIILDIDQAVFDAVTDEWRESLYDLKTIDDIVEHIAFNMIQGRKLSHLDGWADQPDSNVRVIDKDYYFFDVSEIKENE